ncbi:MAG: S8 family serine peptidase [bacterium]
MRNFILFICLTFFLSLNAERYMVEFKDYLPERKEYGFIKANSKYNFIVIDSDYEKIKASYPDAVKIYKEPKLYALYTPNDTYFSYQWSLWEEHYNVSYLLDRGILGNSTVIIGVLDTGVSFENYPIPANEQGLVISATNEYEMYSDFEGINFVQGYDFVSDDAHPNDMNGHGTAVTNVIASTINNSLATSGIIFNASIMPLRVLDETGAGNLTDILDAIEYGVANGCKVLNLSLGGEPGDSNGWDILHSAIIDARNSNVMVLAAAGNDGVSMLSYPAGFEEAISVGAVDYFFERTPYSQYGTNLDFMAPGGYVYQDINGDGEDEGGILCPMPEQTEDGVNVNDFYLYFVEGTSFSTPHLSALAALMYSLGYSTVDEIVNLMIDGSIDLGTANYDNEYGWGYPKPESLFSQPVAIKTIDFDVASDILFFSMIVLNDTFMLDSINLSSLLVNEKLNFIREGSLIMAEFSSSKSGIYSVTAFGRKNGEAYKFKRDFALKAITDPSNVVYHGTIKMFSDSPFVLFFDEGKIISSSHNSSITLTIPAEDAARKEVFCGDISVPAKRYSDRIEFSISKKGTYRISSLSSNAHALDDSFSKKSLLLKTSILNLEGKEGMLFDKSGRLLKESIKSHISFEGLPSGIYFIESERMLWKIIKLF